MENYCTYSNNHKCVLWTDYEVTRYELSEANVLCHENWNEIQHKEKYIKLLQKRLSDNGIAYPPEY